MPLKSNFLLKSGKIHLSRFDYSILEKGGSMETPQQRGPIMKEFINFIREQGVVGLAVGFIMGGSITKVVTSLVNDLINPLLGIILGKAGDLKTMYVQVSGAKVMWGNFANSMIDFLIISAVVYFGVKLIGLDKLDRKRPKPAEAQAQAKKDEKKVEKKKKID